MASTKKYTFSYSPKLKHLLTAKGKETEPMSIAGLRTSLSESFPGDGVPLIVIAKLCLGGYDHGDLLPVL